MDDNCVHAILNNTYVLCPAIPNNENLLFHFFFFGMNWPRMLHEMGVNDILAEPNIIDVFSIDIVVIKNVHVFSICIIVILDVTQHRYEQYCCRAR